MMAKAKVRKAVSPIRARLRPAVQPEEEPSPGFLEGVRVTREKPPAGASGPQVGSFPEDAKRFCRRS